MKELLLAKSNIRKSKGLTVGLILLIILASCFFSTVLMLFTDFNKNPEKLAKKLNSEDAYIILAGDISNVDENYIKNLVKDEVKDCEISRKMGRFSVSTPYGEGDVTPVVLFSKEDEAFKARIGKTEILEEDTSIKNNYIYLPYVYHVGGGFNVGDDYEIKVLEQNYKFKIKGFTNNINFGSHNAGTVEFIVENKLYNEMYEAVGESLQNITIKFILKDGVDSSKFVNKISGEILKKYDGVETNVGTMETSIFARTFVSVIFAVLFLIISLIVIVIVLLMLSNNIANYIKENMKTIGAIKALGYTNNNIKSAFLIQFFIIALISCVAGIGLSYVLTPAVTSILSMQAGMPYTVKFKLLPTIITAITTILIVTISVMFFLRKTNKIMPITALRDGLQTHNFKKNRVSLEKSKLSLNMSLALKTTFFNIKQNIVTFIIIFALVFMGVVGVVLFQNFAVEPKMSLLTFEICDGAVGISDTEVSEDVCNYMKSIDGVKNVRLVVNEYLSVEDVRILFYVLDDANYLNNQDVCYKGRLPKYENEIALSGMTCKSYNYNIGDEIEITKGDKKEKYILSGYIQTTNNMGKEGVILSSGIEKIVGKDFVKMYYFDAEENVDVAEVIKSVENRYGDKVSTYNFKEIISGSISVFKIVAGAIVILNIAISVLVILLVLYLLIKTLINNKKKDYGILKAIGYTSKNIIRQNAISFMPTIILSVVVACITSYFVVNPFIGLVMKMFGVMKVTFTVPVGMIVALGIGFVAISYVIAILLSRKVKKIEPYKLLTEE